MTYTLEQCREYFVGKILCSYYHRTKSHYIILNVLGFNKDDDLTIEAFSFDDGKIWNDLTIFSYELDDLMQGKKYKRNSAETFII